MSDTFTLSGKQFCYQVSDYNGTRQNERAVEVPVGLALLTQALGRGKQVLEVGAVLPHYLLPMDHHTVIDLYEEYPSVINANVLTWEPPHPYDLIVSISTLDHLCDGEEFLKALERLEDWLAPGGLLFVTLPYGQPEWIGGGEWLAQFLRMAGAGYWLMQVYFGRRVLPPPTAVWRMDKIDVWQQQWAQVEDATVPKLAYHGQSPAANTVYMLLWGNLDDWWHT